MKIPNAENRNMPRRRSRDTGVLRLYEKYKVIASALMGALVSVWIAVTWADDKLRKVEQVPKLEEAVLQLKTNQESLERRLSRIEHQQKALDDKLETTQGQILEKLDVLVERGQ